MSGWLKISVQGCNVIVLNNVQNMYKDAFSSSSLENKSGECAFASIQMRTSSPRTSSIMDWRVSRNGSI